MSRLRGQTYMSVIHVSYSLVLPASPSPGCNLTMVLTSLKLVFKIKILDNLEGFQNYHAEPRNGDCSRSIM